ncbi:MAG: hypothetical protein QM489_02675 [Candidatus Izemoplasma sp.]
MNIFYYILPLIVLITLGLFILFKRKNTENTVFFNISDIINLIKKENVIKVDFVRNKIVLDLKDYKLLNLDELKELGAVGITVVGDRIKFYFEKDNEMIYSELKKYIEG